MKVHVFLKASQHFRQGLRTHLWGPLSLHLQRQQFPWSVEHCFKEKAPSPGSQEWLPTAGIAWSRVPRALRSGCPLLGSRGRGFSLSVQETGEKCKQKSPPLQPGDEPGWQSSPVPARSFLCSQGSQELAICADTCRAHPPCQACLAMWDLTQSWEAGQSPTMCREHPNAEGPLTCPRWSFPGQPRPSVPVCAQPHHCL